MANRAAQRWTAPTWACLALATPLAGLLAGVIGNPGDTPAPAAATEGSVRYGRDIRPILADRCFKCHGNDDRARAETGDVRLDSFVGATADIGAGRHPIVPGDPEASELLRRLRSHDPDVRMPPPESKLSVSDREIGLIERWIAQGAEYEEHWAFQAPVRPAPAPVSDESWARNDIDRFILAELDRREIEHSPEADLETLIRRVSLDLTGLPPTPQEIDAFLSDDRPDAYERVVDRLLASPHFGERMAMYWLDVARYADTQGYHHDNYRSQWPWRDWVIDSFNENKPFDRFVIEQLAGDLMPDATLETRVATGFCRNHPITDEGGAIDAEYLVEYAADRVETLSTALLGLTMQCSRCHDHKYDPIEMEDYYGLFSFFNNITEQGLANNGQGMRDKAFPPFVAAPTDEQRAEQQRLKTALEQARAEVERPIPGLAEQQAAWEAGLRDQFGVRWVDAAVIGATSTGGATLEVMDDDSIYASGENPDTDRHAITLRTDATALRLLRLDVLNDERLFEGRAGRAHNGNAVISGIDVEAVSVVDPTQRASVALSYAWADHEQPNGNFDAQNVIRSDERLGWAIGAHLTSEPRTLLLLAEDPFGYEGGTELRVTLRYESVYAKHTLGRVRLGVAESEDVRPALPIVYRDWFMAGPFKEESSQKAFDTDHGPEAPTFLDVDATFGEAGLGWTHKPEYVDGTPYNFGGEQSAFYLGRTIFSPVAREFQASLGSDDAIKVYLNGEELLSNYVMRPVGADQESVTISLRPGENTLVLKIVNGAGPAGFYFKATEEDDAPTSLAPLALVPRQMRASEATAALDEAYRREVSPEYLRRVETLASVKGDLESLEASLPNVMVMEERDEIRPTYVLTRGQYDQPDMSRPVQRQTPRVLGTLDDDARHDRLGLAQWLFKDDHPLTSRVAANRLWQVIFGIGIVRTSEDFGTQGEWPSHPELLDWLAVELRESGWDVKGMLRLIVTSATYRQSSAHRQELYEIDPENRLLARAVRRRMPAEMIRDNALAASGLLVREIGGPSVKPYQPGGLWEERSMPTSNTKFFERDAGKDLYRRGLYTFWKRSAPPPQMATFDAPEREYCVVRRGATSTPLQALVLLNDETYVEIARALAQRVMLEADWENDPVGSIVRMFRLAAGRHPSPDEIVILQRTYEDAYEHFASAAEDAQSVLMYGEAPVDGSLAPDELASMTIVAGVLLNLDETITKD